MKELKVGAGLALTGGALFMLGILVFMVTHDESGTWIYKTLMSLGTVGVCVGALHMLATLVIVHFRRGRMDGDQAREGCKYDAWGNKQCSFEPRRDTLAPTAEMLAACRFDDSSYSYDCVEMMMERMVTERYICDVCTSCGKIVKP